jgi:adenine-specific DNA-methyltransferase
MPDNYNDYSKDELIRLLRERDRKPKFGLVWERDEIEHDKSLNGDFVALDFDADLSTGEGPFSNLIIEGDNFDALRFLRMTHAGKVKCIYIDPPYNTGNRDFIYNDRFIDKDDAYKHSKWLEFMFRRLELAKELLAEDGVIFVSIDDNEVFNLGLLMNRVFGEVNHIATCVWQKRYSRENREAIGDVHEYIFIYAINPDIFKERRNKLPLGEKQLSVYKNPNNDPKGPWRAVALSAQGFRPNQMYEIVSPLTGKRHRPPEGSCWKVIEPQYQRLLEEGRIYFGKTGNSVPSRIQYLKDIEGMVPWTWWPHEEVGHTDEARKEIQSIFGTQTAFDTPKPVRLIERILRIATKPSDLVLDFFAGSGTTAHAVAKLNREDGGNRRFILVSSTEATADTPDKNLCRDVCAERVKRVLGGYRNKKGEAVEGLGGGGPSATLKTGFAYLRARRIPVSRVYDDIQHEQVWLALQLIHLEAFQPYAADFGLQTAESDHGAIAYCAKVNAETLSDLERLAADHAEVIVYSWQPGLLRQRLMDTRFSFAPIPQFLMDRFGVGTSP